MKQYFFDPDEYDSKESVKKARNEMAKKFKGQRIVKSTLENQQRGYSGFGTGRDVSCRSVYMLTVIS